MDSKESSNSLNQEGADRGDNTITASTTAASIATTTGGNGMQSSLQARDSLEEEEDEMAIGYI